MCPRVPATTFIKNQLPSRSDRSGRFLGLEGYAIAAARQRVHHRREPRETKSEQVKLVRLSLIGVDRCTVMREAKWPAINGARSR